MTIIPFSFFFIFLYRIAQLFILIALACILISVFKNRNRVPMYAQSPGMSFSPPPPPPPPPAPKAPRRFGCMGFIGTVIIVFVILQGINGNHTHVKRPTLSEPEKRLQEISQQKRELNARVEKEIPEFVRLLYKQASDIKKELDGATEASKKDYLMEELRDIARTFVFLDKEETEYKDLVSELSSIERTLVRLKESQKLFGTEYEDFMNQSREAMTKAKAKLNVKMNLEMNREASLNEVQIDEKMNELLD